MNDFWVAHWLHSPPEEKLVDGRRVILKQLCFGPAEVHIWFVTEEGGFWHERQLLEGLREGERFLEPVSQDELRRCLENEISLCQRLNQEHLIPLFQRELDRLKGKGA